MLENWRQVTVYQSFINKETTCEVPETEGYFFFEKNRTHTGECTVTACLTYQQKVRKGGDFFYGITGYENHIEGIRSCPR